MGSPVGGPHPVRTLAGAVSTPVSVVVLTYNEEQNIEATLQSVSGWCQEIFVVDSGSTDRTTEIARQFTQNVLDHPYKDHASQWQWSLDNLPLTCEWLLALDADNIVTERLKRQIDDAVERDEPGVDGYYAVHIHHFRGRRVRILKKYWLRLVRHRQTRVDETELVDFRFIVEGTTRELSGEILEANKKEDAIDFWIDKHQKFASRMAAEEVLRRNGRRQWSVTPRLFGNQDERMVWLKTKWYRAPLYVRPFLFFAYRYFLRAGFLDGRNGLVFHILQAFWFRLIVDIRIAEIEEEITAGRLSFDELERSMK